MTDTPENGGPAFPHTRLVPNERGIDYPENVEGFSKREYAAIHLCVPDSGVEWLDDMIRSAKRDYFAGQALANPDICRRDDDFPHKTAYAFADAMLRAREGGEG